MKKRRKEEERRNTAVCPTKLETEHGQGKQTTETEAAAAEKLTQTHTHTMEIWYLDWAQSKNSGCWEPNATERTKQPTKGASTR